MRHSFRLAWLALALSLISGCCTTKSTSGREKFSISWTNNILTVTRPDLPGGSLTILYLEAFLRSGAHDQSWDRTRIPHQTKLLRASDQGDSLEFQTAVQNGVEMWHTVKSGVDQIEFEYTIHNPNSEFVDIQWFQPACIRVADFTARNQTNFIERSFIFTGKGLTRLADAGRTEEALYRGGQVYIPAFVTAKEANPRPLASARPVNGLIGCFSADNKMLLATASDQTHELFEGVYVCLHSDPHVGGLKPGETRKFRAKLYLLPNDVPALLKRYRTDFPRQNAAGKVSF